MGKNRRSSGSWRYQVIKGYKRRAQKFREEAQTVEEKMAWLKVTKWFETILDHRQMNDDDTIVLPAVKLEADG
ncbi:hypothetical protein ES703_66102 [subsurface metagenome]